MHEGFTLRDLIKPDAARLRRNLSAIINFQKFREEKIEQWACHGRKTVELENTVAALEAERRELETALQREKNLRSMEQPAISELQRAVAGLEATKGDLEATAGRVAAAIAEQKRTVAELIDAAVRGVEWRRRRRAAGRADPPRSTCQQHALHTRARSPSRALCPLHLVLSRLTRRPRWTPRPKGSRRSSTRRGTRS